MENDQMISCPNCGSNPRFDIESQQLKCPNCGSLFDPATFPEETRGADSQTVTGDYAGQPDMMQVTIYTCSQCGGELMSTDSDATVFCSYCGSHQILEERLSQQKRPEHIIPFKVTKEDCKKAYAARLRRSLFAPKELKDPAYIDEFRGIYMPYWFYDYRQRGTVTLNGTREHRSGNYRIIDHYDLSAETDNFYGGISHDASTAMDDTISESLAPYDISKSLKFRTPYLSGFYADIPDVKSNVYKRETTEMAARDALERVEALKEFKGYSLGKISDSTAVTRTNTKLEKASAAMLPVWFLSYRKNDRVAYAAINGQTGKLTADIPIDHKKYILAVGIMTLLIWVVLQFFNISSLRSILFINMYASMFGGLVYGMVVYKLQSNLNRQQWEKQINRKREEPEAGDDEKDPVTKAKKKSELAEKRRQNPPGLLVSVIFLAVLLVINAVLSFFGMRIFVAAFPFVVAFYVSLGFSDTGYKRGIISNWVLAVVTALGALVWAVNPYVDELYFGSCILMMGAIIWCFFDALFYYNQLMTRPLPQFQKTGGDDRA